MLALHYLLYILELPDAHLARCAFEECRCLHAIGKPSWLGDLAVVINCMPHSVPAFNPLQLTLESTKRLIDHVKCSMNAHVDTAIKSSSKGQFLVGRLECDDEGALAHQSLHFWHYLRVPFSEHRKAFTQMLLADHSLAEVRLRYAERYRPAVPLMWQLCRFCEENVEDPPHALFGCNGCLELQLLRDAFLNEATERCPILHLVTLSATPESFFHGHFAILTAG